MLYGAAKAGKSIIAMQLARCIGVGEPFLGLETSQGRVLYLQFEIGTSVLQDRMRQVDKDYDNVYVGTTFDMKLDSRRGQTQLELAIMEVAPNVVILDPLYKILEGDENDVHDGKIVTDFLDHMIELYGCSFLIIHHMGKDPSQGARGTSHFNDWHESIIEIKKTSKNGEPLQIKLTTKLARHTGLPAKPTEAVMENFEFTETEAKMTILQQVSSYLQLHAVATPSELFAAGIGSQSSRAPVQSALTKLVEAGMVSKVGRGVYEWAPAYANDNNSA